jgi:hypothetical protein
VARDLDAAYNALKKYADAAPELPNTEVDALKFQAVDALAVYFAHRLNEVTESDGSGMGGYREAFTNLSPKAFIIITQVVGVLGDLAEGKTDPALEKYLEGLTFGGD